MKKWSTKDLFDRIKQPEKKQKYRNTPKEYNGTKFHSTKEADYCAKLDILKKASRNPVVKYEKQVPYVIKIKGNKIFTYFLDFKVWYQDGTIEHVDVKGFKTAMYRLKKKAVEAEYEFKIIEK